MRLSTALQQLGAGPETLTAAERQSLDDDGFVALPGLLSGSQLDAVTETFLSLLEVRHTFDDTTTIRTPAATS